MTSGGSIRIVKRRADGKSCRRWCGRSKSLRIFYRNGAGILADFVYKSRRIILTLSVRSTIRLRHTECRFIFAESVREAIERRQYK